MQVRSALAVLALVAAPWGLAGCGGEGRADDASAPSVLPANLCAEVPDDLVQRWALVEDDHARISVDGRTSATCSMTGEVDGGPVALALRLTAYAADGRQLEAEDWADACADLDRDADPEVDRERDKGPGRYVEDDGTCTWTASSTLEEQRGDVREATLTSSGLVTTVSLRHTGTQWQLVAGDVVVLGAQLSRVPLL
jgi:hypothetical protein